jgi:acetyl-CoA C-acetyltransferase
MAAYTVAHGRDGTADWGLAVCDLPDRTRCYARMQDPDLLDEAERSELVGARLELVPGDGNVNLVKR